MSKILRAVWGLAADAVAGAVNWLRDPCGCARALGLLLAGLCLHLALQSYERGQEAAALQSQVEHEQQRVADRDEALAQVVRELEQEAQRLELAKAEAAAALRELATDLQAAQSRADEWQRRYADRPVSCAAALAQLDSVCPSLRGY